MHNVLLLESKRKLFISLLEDCIFIYVKGVFVKHSMKYLYLQFVCMVCLILLCVIPLSVYQMGLSCKFRGLF